MPTTSGLAMTHQGLDISKEQHNWVNGGWMYDDVYDVYGIMNMDAVYGCEWYMNMDYMDVHGIWKW